MGSEPVAAEEAETLLPETEAQVREAVAWAVSEDVPLAVRGHGSKAAIGRPMRTVHTLDLSRLSGITLYEPEELVLTARAGTPVAEIAAALAARGQAFQFEPMDCGPLLAGAAERGTAGGLLAANLSGPRRLTAGAARDHTLGIRAVTGRGDLIKSGGRVVKNVTGYDLSKGLAGSWGTLAVFTEITFKVLPRPQTEATLVVSGLNDAAASKAMAVAMATSAEVSAAAHLPESVRAAFLDGGLPDGAATVLRLEGFAPSVEARLASLSACLGRHGPFDRLEAEASARLWREIRDVKPFWSRPECPVWRVSVAPTDGHRLVAALRLETGVDAFYDWQGGLVWLRMEAGPEAELVRRFVAALGGGHAMLVRTDAGTRAALSVFEPQDGALAALVRRLKEQFDPLGVLNPGRMAAGA